MTTLAELQGRRAAYLAAEAKILQSQQYQVGDGANARMTRRAELSEVRQAIAELDTQIAAFQSISTPARRIVYLR